MNSLASNYQTLFQGHMTALFELFCFIVEAGSTCTVTAGKEAVLEGSSIHLGFVQQRFPLCLVKSPGQQGKKNPFTHPSCRDKILCNESNLSFQCGLL